MDRHNWTLALSLIAIGALAGCSSAKRIESTEVPKQAPSNEKVEKATMTTENHYTVAQHDTLWGIAGKSDIYGDNFEWPLIFKANRDSIKDPDLIYPQQDFVIQKGLSEDEVAHAKKLAMETPKYVPHSKPRATLPLDYF
jgi:LysM domain